MSQKQTSYDRLDPHQIHQQTFDSATDSVRVHQIAGPLPFKYDNGSLALSNANTTETYTFKDGATVKGTVVINYTDSTRAVMTTFVITAV